MQCSNPPRSGKAIFLMFLTETLYVLMNAKNVSLISLFVKYRILCFYKFRKHFFHWQPGHKAAVGLPSGKGGRPDTPRMGRPPGRNQRSCAFHAFCCAVWKLLLTTYENQYIFNVLQRPKRPHVWAPAWALAADLWFECFGPFGVPFLCRQAKTYENAHTFQARVSPVAAATFFYDFFW